MRSGLWSVACVSLGLLTAACNLAQDQRYYREGIGNDLYWSGLPETTQLQQLYVGYICEQAGIPVESQSGSTLCDYGNFQPAYWATFVQAGMNDIDLRCDAYLSWLDDKKRTTQPILKQINDMSVVSQSIMRLTGVGADPITIVGLAFGLAADTFTNVRSRLLLEVNHSTVQTVVLSRQREYRLDILKKRIDNRPAAIHALRSYLRMCMPFTIEMEINNTVVVFERGGAGALVTQPPLITPETVGRPLAARDPVRQPSRPVREAVAGYDQIIEQYDPQVHGKRRVQSALRALCVLPEELETVDNKMKFLIQTFERRLHEGASDQSRSNGQLDEREIDRLIRARTCPSEFSNFYERSVYENHQTDKNKRKALTDLIKGLNKVQNGGTLPETATLDAATRAKIRSVRPKLGLPASEQVTSDLLDKLETLP